MDDIVRPDVRRQRGISVIEPDRRYPCIDAAADIGSQAVSYYNGSAPVYPVNLFKTDIKKAF